tara:strand:+ start:4299 stop:4838 length:540 start_codon:yes stop_codon:yes gene_type:complete
MKNIEIEGLEFELLINQGKILEQINSLAKELKENYPDNFPLCLIVLNGASIFASQLLDKLDNSVQISFIKVQSYDGLSSTGNIIIDYLPYELIKNRDVLLIEDIVDTGLTMNSLTKELKKNGARKVKCVTLLFKPNQYQYPTKPHHIGFSLEDNFVIGYGMDYNQKGRNLSDIYKNITC